MLSVTLMVTYMSCLILSPISIEAQLPFVMQIRQCGRQMDIRSCTDPLTDGKFYVLWKDSSTSWEKLSDLKESHPLETAEYAVSQSI